MTQTKEETDILPRVHFPALASGPQVNDTGRPPCSWSAVLCAGISLVIVASALAAAPSARAAPAKPIVYAHYMHCFILGGGPPQHTFIREGVEDFAHWPPSETTCMPWWSARLAPLVQSGAEAVRMDFDMAQEAGLDALSLLIGDKHLPGSPWAPGMRLAAQVASTHQVKLIPDLWDSLKDPTREDFVRYGESVKALMDEYPEAFLKYRGKWLLHLGNPMRYGRANADRHGFLQWEDYSAFFEPWGGPQAFYLVVNHPWDPADAETGWGQAVDAFCMWLTSVGWGCRQTEILLDLAATYDKQICWPVCATWFGGHPGPTGLAEGLGISRLSDQWRRALDIRPALVQVHSWNDFTEDHYLTESNYRGRTLIELTRYFAAWFHTGEPPGIEKEKVFLFHHRQLIEATISEATIVPINHAYRVTPTTDYLNVVTMLKEPATVRLQLNDLSWELAEVPAGLHEWLVYVPSPRTERGPDNQAWNQGPESYPESSDYRTVTVTKALEAGTPIVQVLREGLPVMTVASRTGLAGEARWYDWSLIGTMAEANE